ncbi:MAG: threonine-phosphate decarboxylase [Pseudomonadota bacterium]
MAGQDHGGGIDAARARYGGDRADWLDLSTGINPNPYPLRDVPEAAWCQLPDSAARDRLIKAARRFWAVPEGAEVIPAPGASALIAQMPVIAGGKTVLIPGPTYNEHAAAFRAWRYHVVETDADKDADTCVFVHPNNPTGGLTGPGHPYETTIIDESFCDVMPGASHIGRATEPGVVILKSFGKFWGLAGMRLGFAIGDPGLLSPDDGPTLTQLLGPWALSGPALEIGAQALEDDDWAAATRAQLAKDANRLDRLMEAQGARCVGGTTLFRLYDVADAKRAFEAFATHHILTRIFPYSDSWIRLGLPPENQWERLETALGTVSGAIRERSDTGSAVPPSR